MLLYAVLLEAVELTGADGYFARDACSNNKVSFYLRTREDTEGVLMTRGNLESAPLIEEFPLIVLIHGYGGNHINSPNMELVKAYLMHGGYNVLSVDWSQMAKGSDWTLYNIVCYIRAAFNVELAGQCAAEFLSLLYETRGPHWKLKTHVVGFSLGAHVAGVLAHHLPGIPRITGLEAALPLFDPFIATAQSRLDESDAQFVDAYHTNAGWKGRFSQVGHLDFYINNGWSQPGCQSNASCDHVRAVEIFAESINSSVGFLGVPCTVGVLSFLLGGKTCVPDYYSAPTTEVRAGEFPDFRARGTYQFNTNNRPPFALGTNSILRTNLKKKSHFADFFLSS